MSKAVINNQFFSKLNTVKYASFQAASKAKGLRGFALQRFRNRFLWEHYYKRLGKPKVRNGLFEAQKSTKEAIINRFKTLGVQPEQLTLSKTDYESYMQQADYSSYHTGVLAEKSLEHFVAAKLLGLNKKDVYIDIASAQSPVPSIYSKLYGCKVYRQDLIYPAGLHGNVIGGDACSLPLPDGFASKMALHCSFEHFEGNADSRFIREAERVLAKDGLLCILPLYLSERFGVVTNPVNVPKGMRFDDGALLYCDRRYPARHGRFYSPEQFVKRVLSVSGLKPHLYVVTNEKEIDASCYLQFAVLFKK
ncbi:MAG: methyltransferase domain-containing protein [Candidatus Bathyarchaeia archaeon]